MHMQTYMQIFWETLSISSFPGHCSSASHSIAELQIIGGTEDNSKIIFLISQRKHML